MIETMVVTKSWTPKKIVVGKISDREMNPSVWVLENVKAAESITFCLKAFIYLTGFVWNIFS